MPPMNVTADDAKPTRNMGPIPLPVVVDSSTDWRGVDGPWSTFVIRPSSAGQDIRVLPSTSLGQTWLIKDTGCQNMTNQVLDLGLTCRESRGGLFKPTETSLNNNRTYYAAYQILRNYGFYNKQLTVWTDNITFGFSTTSSSTQSRPFTIPMAATSDWQYTWVGLLGIDGRPTNLSDHGGQEKPIDSLLHSMKNSNAIPSRSWSYTAGSVNRPPRGISGTLILGGYDTNKFIDNSVRFPFRDDDELALTVTLSSMTLAFGKSTQNFHDNLSALIDSNRPYLILPLQWCRDIATALQLKWDNTSSHYLITSEQHGQLKAQNPSLTFEISPYNVTTVSSSEAVNISVSYNSLGLRLKYPKINNDSYYFPMLPAEDDNQITLGRAFMQDAYVISDYERREFQVKQVDWSNPNFTRTNLKPILSPGMVDPPTGLGKAGIGGIAAGLVILSAFFVLLILLFRRAGYRFQREQQPAGKEDDDGSSEPSELNSPRSPHSPNMPLSPGGMLDGKLFEIDSGSIHESGGTAILPPQEMEQVQISELPDMTGTLAGYYKEAELDSSELYVADIAPTSSKASPETTVTDSTLIGSARSKSTGSSSTTLSNPATATLVGGGSPIPQTPIEFYGGRPLPDWRLADRKEAALLRSHERNVAARGKQSGLDDDERPPASPIPKTPVEYYGRAVDFRPGTEAKQPAGNSLQVPPVPALPAARLAPPPPASPIPQTPIEYYGGSRNLPRSAPTVKDKRARNDRRAANENDKGNDVLRVPGARPAGDDSDAIMPMSPMQQTPIEFYGRHRAFQWPPAAAAASLSSSSASSAPSGAASAPAATAAGIMSTTMATNMTMGSSSAERGWVGRAPDVPEMMLTPPTPISPSSGAAADGRPAIINERRPPVKKSRRDK